MQKLSAIMPENNSPFVSIVMPTYNRANFIVETIKSIQKQTYSNWELIIVDDGSTDQTSEIIGKMKDERIRYYKELRQGMVHARNSGLKKADGYFIAFMDSDDLWADTKLEKQLISLFQHPDAYFCLSNGYDFQHLNKPISYFYNQKEGMRVDDLFISFFKSELAATIPALMIRKQVLEIVNGFDESQSVPDVAFILSVSRHFKGIILFEPLFFRRVHKSSDSTIHHFVRHCEGVQLIKDHQDKLPRDVFLNALFRSHINFGEVCIKQSQKRKAVQQFFEAWKYRPLSIVPFKKMAKTFFRSIKKDPSPALSLHPYNENSQVDKW